MGCGCATFRTRNSAKIGPLHRHDLSVSTRQLYIQRKQDQLGRFLANFVSHSTAAADFSELAAAVSHDCQGISSTNGGSETELIIGAVNFLIGLKYPATVVVKAALDLVKELVIATGNRHA